MDSDSDRIEFLEYRITELKNKLEASQESERILIESSRQDMVRLNWLDRKTRESGYAVQIQCGQKLPFERAVVTTGVNSGPHMRQYANYDIRRAIDLAITDETKDWDKVD